jgi:hypothetical protein
MGQDKILHKRSAVVIDNSPKLPTENQLDYGELAINFADGYETLTIRNSADKITEFKSKEYFENIIIENELVTAAALNDLNVRKSDISSLATVATTGSYNDLSNKPNIPNAGMEDADESVDEVNTLPFVSYNEQILTEEQKEQARKNIDVNNKQDKVLKFENVLASHWVSDSTYTDYPYRCDMSCAGVTEAMYAEVTFSLEQITSENFAPICETKQDVVSIWSKENTSVTIPTIIIIV